ncbi:hypothetical protein B0H14DRAFT_3685165 [Mycena olivaceomarginata]|nr:hypothetical protein B0H14DRAFT_3685165 [Mycena olivaceomarginata]
MEFGGTAPWKSARELYSTIDEIQSGDMPWKTYEMRYSGPLPSWCSAEVDDAKRLRRHGPVPPINHAGHRVWSNLMSGDWAWKQADLIAADPANHGCAFVPVVGGNDKTTVSNTIRWYASPGVLTGPARRAHGKGVLPVAFLAIPKTQRSYNVPDGHLRRVIYGIGPYIADYPEQVWLAAIVQNWCPKCEALPDHLDAEGIRLRTRTKTETLIRCFDPGILWDDYGVRADIVVHIHELLSSDLLHQVIKGTFKDHIVSWINEYLHLIHSEKRALEIIQDIDRRISAVPEFPGLRRFPDGRDFSQWTGDDSKALMKIYLAAVAGYLPSGMVKALSSFMDFCYLVRRNAISTPDLTDIKNALDAFHHHRQIFIDCGVRIDISLPRQHSLVHYIRFIRLFGSPNGLCSSITESKHIKAVKEPWRRSSRFNALSQMLVTLQRLDKMAAHKSALAARGMTIGTTSSYTASVLAGNQPQVAAAAAAAALDDDEDDDGMVHGPKSLSDIKLAPTSQRGYPKSLNALAVHINQPRLPELLRRFLYEVLNGPPADDALPVPLDACPVFAGRVAVHHSAIAHFYAPSDLGGAGGMYRERIRSNPNWHGYARRDTVLVDVGAPIMRGIVIGRVQLFFSFDFGDKLFECALVNWLVPVGNAPDPDTGMWVVELERERGVPSLAVIDVDSIARASHLIGLSFSDALDAFNTYFVNPYADHHMYEFLK